MSDKSYIDRGAVIDGINKAFDSDVEDWASWDVILIAHDVIAEIPDADVVEVVRCKDCKHYGEMLPGVDKRFICHKTALNTTPNFFCAFGERWPKK